MTETETQHTFILTIDNASMARTAKDPIWWLEVYAELAAYRATERTERPEGLYCRAELTF